MKIGFVFDDTLDTTDGIQQYVLRLGEWYETQGHEVHYLVGQTTRTDLAHVHSLSRNVAVRFNGNRLSMPLPAAAGAIKKLLQAEQFDVLHVQVPYSPLMAGRVLAAAPARTRIIGTFHIAPYSALATLGAHALALWSKPTLRKFDQIISVSSAAAAFARQTYGLTTPVVPNVVDYARFHTAQPLAQYGDETKTILFLGRLVTRKGCQKLLEAIALLQTQAVPAFRVVICGGGPLKATLQNYVIEHQLEAIVEFAGRVSEDDKPRYYASADIAVFPSSGGESFGIVLIEAMAGGRAAVLGGDNPGYRSVLQTNDDLLFAATDARALADKLAALLHDEPLRQQYATWGMHETEQYDVQRVGQQLLALYAQVASNSSKE